MARIVATMLLHCKFFFQRRYVRHLVPLVRLLVGRQGSILESRIDEALPVEVEV
jgi:hypothetical protein